MASCCPPGSIPFAKEDPNYTPLGRLIEYDKIGETSLFAYVVGDGSKALIFIHDMFGLDSGLNKLLCDTLSTKLPGYRIIAPDFFVLGNIFGDDPMRERGIWLLPKFVWTVCCCTANKIFKKYSWDNISGSIFDKVTTYFLKNGVESFTLLGFCWGAYVSSRACGSSENKDKITGNISVHPSVDSVSYLLSEREMEIVDAVACPQMVASTIEESHHWKPQGRIQKFFGSKMFGPACEFYLYRDQHHGFFTRGDTKVRYDADFWTSLTHSMCTVLF